MNKYCYVVDHHLPGQPPTTVRIMYGEEGYFACPDIPVGLVSRLNTDLGVTPEVADAMLCGSMFGWDAGGAQPAVVFFGEGSNWVHHFTVKLKIHNAHPDPRRVKLTDLVTALRIRVATLPTSVTETLELFDHVESRRV